MPIDLGQFKKKEEIEEKEVIKPALIKTIPIRHKEPVIPKEVLSKEEIKEYIDKQIRELLGKETVKEKKIVIDPEKLYIKLRSLDENAPENAYYKVIIERAKSNRMKSYLMKYASVITKYFDEIIK